MAKLFAASRVIGNRLTVKQIVLDSIRRNDDVLFGNQALNRRVPMAVGQVQTSDYDVLSRRNPQVRAREIEKKLDKRFRGDVFFTKPALHPGTHKVMFVGSDLRKNTKDDETIADISRLKKGVKFTKKNGINVITVEQIKKDRQRALKRKDAAFRREKDRRAIALLKSRSRFKKNRLI